MTRFRLKRGRGKYGNKRTTIDGHRFDSLAEGRRYTELRILQLAGCISGLEIHPVYVLQDGFKIGKKTIRPIAYEGDFCYIDHERKDAQVVEDVKGVRTETFKIKEKMFRKLYPHLDLRILSVKR